VPAIPSVPPMNALPAPRPTSGFFRRFRAIFGGSQQSETATSTNSAPAAKIMEQEELFEYHNPTLGLSGYGYVAE